MIFGIKKRSDILGVLSLVLFVIGGLNALEYFFAGKNYLAKYNGVVSDVKHETYLSRSSKRQSEYYTKTSIRLDGYKKIFRLVDRSDAGGFIPVEKGDTIRLYVKKWYQQLYVYTLKTNIYYVEDKNGDLLYNNLRTWKSTLFMGMCFAGGLALFLFLIFLDQSKNISLEIWFQRRVLMNKNYRK
jgi:hypothetical protein